MSSFPSCEVTNVKDTVPDILSRRVSDGILIKFPVRKVHALSPLSENLCFFRITPRTSLSAKFTRVTS